MGLWGGRHERKIQVLEGEPLEYLFNSRTSVDCPFVCAESTSVLGVLVNAFSKKSSGEEE